MLRSWNLLVWTHTGRQKQLRVRQLDCRVNKRLDYKSFKHTRQYWCYWNWPKVARERRLLDLSNRRDDCCKCCFPLVWNHSSLDWLVEQLCDWRSKHRSAQSQKPGRYVIEACSSRFQTIQHPENFKFRNARASNSIHCCLLQLRLLVLQVCRDGSIMVVEYLRRNLIDVRMLAPRPSTITWKRCKIGGKFVSITNRKYYMSFRLVPKSVTLNDLERRNGRCIALFHFENRKSI